MLIEAIWTIWNLFIFLQKDYAHTKNIQRKTNDFHPLRNIRAHQKCRLCCFLCAYFCFLSWFLLAGVFYAQNLFVKKKINRFEIVQIASINTTTDVYPSSIDLSSSYLHALVFTRNRLWEWISSFYENIF